MAERGDGRGLEVTALYTAGTWAWARLPFAELHAFRGTRNVFAVVNAVLAVARLLVGGGPVLRYELVHRHTAIDALIRREAPAQVLELGAGLSPRGAALSAEGVEVVEVDLPHVVARKEALLARTEAGRAVLARPTLRRIGADAVVTPLEALLRPTGRAVLVAEGLLLYFEAEAQRALWRRAAAWLRPAGGAMVFDLTPADEQPDVGLVGRVLGAIFTRLTRSRMVRDARDRHAIAEELRAAGFDEVEIVEPAAVAHAWALPFPERRTHQVLFVGRVRPS